MNDCALPFYLPEMEDWPPLLRLLLLSDGTLTLALQAYFQEKPRLTVLQQSQNNGLIYREITLSLGKEVAVYATSTLRQSALPLGVDWQQDLGIGEALRNAMRPTFRQLLAVRGRHQPAELPEFLQTLFPGEDYVARRYQIFCPDPAMVIDEYFPWSFWQSQGT